jgi:Holliday junction resolvase RusA-like endonuclease
VRAGQGAALSFTVELPMPPSLNNAYENFQARSKKTGKMVTRRRKSDDYTAWKNAAALLIRHKVPPDKRIGGPVRVTIDLPTKMRGDVDNRIKPILDALVVSGRIDDDRNVESISAWKVHPSKDRVVVGVSSVMGSGTLRDAA